ncbi:MAG: helix-turn-helix domain-containing protein [Cyclobacteriaceae bacterium]|jgi:L-amino acid N-acyltransferase YncA|nr:helix-turn-helix domain-containing protein [Cyclobacteriaceae bacterium]
MDDKELIIKATSGDRNALEEILKRYQGWVYNTALSFVAEPNDAKSWLRSLQSLLPSNSKVILRHGCTVLSRIIF